jgi:hypothetical protein
MVAPGLHLEFLESKAFAQRIEGNGELGFQILELLRNRPYSGILICSGIRQLKFTLSGQRYALIHGRKGNRVSLMYLYQLPEEENFLVQRCIEIIKKRPS